MSSSDLHRLEFQFPRLELLLKGPRKEAKIVNCERLQGRHGQGGDASAIRKHLDVVGLTG